MSHPNRDPRLSLLRLILLTIVAGALALARATPLTATPATTPWSAPTTIASGLSDAAHPALAYTRDGAAHAVWESGGQLYYATRPPDGGWQPGARIAAGMSPEMIADSEDVLHLVFSNRFFGMFEVYYMVRRSGHWSLPTNVSHTTGVSGEPTLAQSTHGVLHAAWMDYSPGYWTTYHAILDNGSWSNQPVPNARGKSPALTASPDGSLYLTWQDHFPVSTNESDSFDILISRYAADRWNLPLNVSDRPDVDSLGSHLAAATNGLIHVTWVDNHNEVRYASGLGVAWSTTQNIALNSVAARGPRIIADQFDRLHVAWDEGNVVREANALQIMPVWPEGNQVAAASGNMRDITMARLPRGGVAMAWVEYAGPGNATIHEAQYKIDLKPASWLPILLHP